MIKTKIFVVEDERIISLALQRALHKLGYAVAGAESSGEAALQAIGSVAPDLVLMDIHRACRTLGLRVDLPWPPPTVLLMLLGAARRFHGHRSWHATVHSRKRLLASISATYVNKPLRINTHV